MSRLRRLFTTIVLLLVCIGPARAGNYSYHTIKVGDNPVTATSVNAQNYVVGIVGVGGSLSTEGFVEKDGKVTLVTVPNGTNTILNGVNDEGIAVGSFVPGGSNRTVTFTYNIQTGVQTIVAQSPADSFDGAYISRTGEIAGVVDPDDPGFEGFVLRKKSLKEFRVPKARYTAISGINRFGEVCGYAGFPNSELVVGFTRINGVISIISIPGSTQTFVSSCDDSGTIFGSFYDEHGSHGYTLVAGQLTTYEYPVIGSSKAGVIASYFPDIESFVLVGGQYYQIRFPNSGITLIGSIGPSGTLIGSYYGSEKKPGHAFVAICAPKEQPCTQ